MMHEAAAAVEAVAAEKGPTVTVMIHEAAAVEAAAAERVPTDACTVHKAAAAVEAVAEDLDLGVKKAAEFSKKRSGKGSWKPEQVTYESIRNQLRCLQGHRLRGTACCPEPGGLGFCDRCGRTVEVGEAVMHCWQRL